MSAYLAGAYEEEIAPALLELIRRDPPVVIDVGAAEGYYAVGIARMLPQAVVYAYDKDPAARKACHRTADLNATPNVIVGGRVTHKLLQRRLVRGALVICDCEGYEVELLDADRVPGLRHAAMVVELHDFIDRSISDVVVGRFEASHDVSVISAGDRDLDRPQLEHLTLDARRAAMDEGRPTEPWPMRWAIMSPKVGDKGSTLASDV